MKIEIKQIKTNKIIEMNKIKIKNNNSCYEWTIFLFLIIQEKKILCEFEIARVDS